MSPAPPAAARLALIPSHLRVDCLAGWVAVTASSGERVELRVHGPEVAGFGLRTPPLLPHVASLKGERLRKSAAYKPLRAAGQIHGLKPSRN